MSLESLERGILAVETVLILLTIGSIATVDYVVGPQTSLGPLYLIPLSYSALSHRLATTLSLVVVCVVLRQLFGPLGNAADPWMVFGRDLVIAGVFVVIVIFLRRLGDRRRRIFELARRQRDELSGEVEMAARVQRRLLAMADPPRGDLDIAGRTVPLRAVGGDYYDFIDLGDRCCGVVVADVSGKGVPAGLLMPAFRFGIRSVVAGQGAPAERIAQLNREFCRTTDPRQYATVFYARVELDTGRITYINCGQVQPLLIDAEGGHRRLDAGGPPIGLLEEAEYESADVALEPGGTLVLFTDGITEAENPTGEEYGMRRLTELAIARRGGSAAEIVEGIFAGVNAFVEGVEAGDDTTVIVLKKPR